MHLVSMGSRFYSRTMNPFCTVAWLGINPFSDYSLAQGCRHLTCSPFRSERLPLGVDLGRLRISLLVMEVLVFLWHQRSWGRVWRAPGRNGEAGPAWALGKGTLQRVCGRWQNTAGALGAAAAMPQRLCVEENAHSPPSPFLPQHVSPYFLDTSHQGYLAMYSRP